MRKFCETLWRWILYVCLFSYGIKHVWSSVWLWDPIHCWTDFPYQNMEPWIKNYYWAELSVYGSLSLSVAVIDIRRKDFVEQILHHIVTMFLLTFSYCANFFRIGTLVMVLHDSSDVFLELAKLFVYMKKSILADITFGCFAVTFLFTRCYLYPTLVLHTTWVKSMWLYTPFPGYYFFNFFLFALMILNLFWSYLILKMAYGLLSSGGKSVENDSRSDAEEYTDSEEEKKCN